LLGVTTLAEILLKKHFLLSLISVLLLLFLIGLPTSVAQQIPFVKPLPMNGWPQWGGTSHRNNLSLATNLAIDFNTQTGRNIRWQAELGSTNNSPVVYRDKILIGTSNLGNRIERYADQDLAVLLCFDQAEGKFLWQYSSPRLADGRAVDWPGFGMASMPVADDNRIWFVSNRAEVVCLDLDGFLDEENDGPFQDEPSDAENEADVIWKFDLREELKVHPHNLTTSSPTAVGNLLLLNTGNGVDQGHLKLAAADAPSFVAIDRDTGKLVWSDASPGKQIMHGQWSSPAFGIFAGVPQAIFAGGDGWLYSFDFRAIAKGETELLWKFDCNPKQSVWKLGGAGSRNNLLATPMIYQDRIYIGTGQDPEHGTGKAVFHCIDPTKRGDVSPQLVFADVASERPIAFKLPQACDEKQGDVLRDNPNSASIWQFTAQDLNANGAIEGGEQMQRTLSTAVAADGLIYICCLSGHVRCLEADTGKLIWIHDTESAIYGSPIIADGKLILATEEGYLLYLESRRRGNQLSAMDLRGPVYGTPTAVGETLYIATRQLFAIAKGDE
jgi:outer membrane protein assembly factor BamB